VNQKRVDFGGFRKWVQEGKGRRSVELRVGKREDENYVDIYVYDYELQVGQFVEKLEDIDLEGALQKKIEGVLGRARKLFGTTNIEEEQESNPKEE